jgi:DNA-binding response OmpR family regulator
MQKYRILVTEDSKTTSDLIRLHLTNKNYVVDAAYNSSEALELIKEYEYDLIILDILLPDFNGYELCEKIRQSIYCPIIIVSSIGDQESILKALSIGADDYITKPFNVKEIEARIAANIRRNVIYKSSHKDNSGKPISIRDMILDNKKHSLSYKDKTVQLTITEYNLLMNLYRGKGVPKNYETLYEETWGVKYLDDIKSLKVHISNLRKKIKALGYPTEVIENIRGRGYILNLD